MEIRFIRSVALALAAITLVAEVADAQQRTRRRTTRSQRRIPVQKEAPPRVDTVTVVRVDTVTRTFRDTVTITRYDTVTRTQTVPMTFTRRSGFYTGIGAGGSPTLGHLDNAQAGNAHLMAMVGYDMMNSPLGFRVDGTVNRFVTNDLAYQNNGIRKEGEPTIMTLAGNVTLNLPINPTTWNNVGVYALAGGAYNRYRYVAMVGDSFDDRRYNTEWSDAFGFQVGGGANVGIGPAQVFMEARWVRFNYEDGADEFRDVAFIPISVGFKF